MIYPGTYDITVLQNSTWAGVFRATTSAQGVEIDVATATFTAACHGLLAGDAVVFTPTTAASELPCGLLGDVVYYVMAANLTEDTFKVSTTIAGSSVALHGAASGSYTVSKPMNLSGYTVDADIVNTRDSTQAATFTTTITDATLGRFSLELSPATTLSLPVRTYSYDVSLTSGAGVRYYWLTGLLTVQRTYSRN